MEKAVDITSGARLNARIVTRFLNTLMAPPQDGQ